MKLLSNLTRQKKKLVAVAVDFIMLPLTFCLAVWVRYDALSEALLRQYSVLILAAPLVAIPVFIKLGFYRAVIRYIDHKIVYVIATGVTVSVVALIALAAFKHPLGYSRGVFVIYWAGAILYALASRFTVRGYLRRSRTHSGICVAIYGAGHAGTQLASALRAGNEYLPVAFIDDAKDLRYATISGVKVFPSSDLPKLIVKREISEVFLAMPSLSKAQQKKIIDRLEPLKIKIKLTPPLKKLLNGELRVQDIQEVDIEDLLGRDSVEPDRHLIGACIKGKAVLVSGAGGSIGSELCRQIIQQNPARLILLEQSEFALYSIEQELRELQKTTGVVTELVPFLGSVLDQGKCTSIMETFAVETVYHAAAYKHVPLVEHNPIEGIRNNVFGTLNLVRAAVETKVKSFVLISTDKAVRPTNVMGATKRLAELILQAFARQQEGLSTRTRFCSVRFGNVLGSSGSVVPLFRRQILAGGPITLTHPEITRYFMTIPEAAQLVLQGGAMGEGGEVFVLDMGDPVKILDLAKRMVHLSGLELKGESESEGAIEIKHIGLRPGEKLYEELLIGGDVEGTEHPLIMRARETEIPWIQLEKYLIRLQQACDQFDFEELRALLLDVVAEYTPQGEIEDFIWRRRVESKDVVDRLMQSTEGGLRTGISILGDS